jgi:hypothetical protein
MSQRRLLHSDVGHLVQAFVVNFNALFSLQTSDAIIKDYLVLSVRNVYLTEENIPFCCLAIRRNRARESNCVHAYICNYIIYRLIFAYATEIYPDTNVLVTTTFLSAVFLHDIAENSRSFSQITLFMVAIFVSTESEKM